MVTTAKRYAALLLTLCLLLLCLPIGTASAAGSAIDMDEARELLNSQPLHPQKTGYPAVDALLEQILAPYAEEDTYTKVKAAYDWAILNIDFSWEPYSQNWAPAYDKFDVFYDLEYDASLQEVVSYDTVNRAYHAMTCHEGVCYDYSSVFALLTRYIGLDSYIHTGYFALEPGFGNGLAHHGWTELVLDGKNYIFDLQRDYRMSYSGASPIPYYYFGIPYENAWRYTQETDLNAARDALFLPVTEEREHYTSIEVDASASGTVTGGGTYLVGDTVTLTVTGDAEFFGWFTENAELCTQERTYTFTADESRKLIAVFKGEYFVDTSNGTWYYKAADETGERWIVRAIEPVNIDEASLLIRTMAANLVARVVMAELIEQETGLDAAPQDAWLAKGVAWAEQLSRGSGVDCDRSVLRHAVTGEPYALMQMHLMRQWEAEY